MSKRKKTIILIIGVVIIIVLSFIVWLLINNKDNSAPTNNNISPSSITEKDVKITDKMVLDKEYNDMVEGYSLQIRTSDNSWYEVDSSPRMAFFGVYDNKVYYSDVDSFNYIDLSDSYEPVEWIKIKLYEDEYNETSRYDIVPNKGFIYNGVIYFIDTLNSPNYIYSLDIATRKIKKLNKLDKIEDYEAIYGKSWEIINHKIYLISDDTFKYYDVELQKYIKINTEMKKPYNYGIKNNLALIVGNKQKTLYIYDLKENKKIFKIDDKDGIYSPTVFNKTVYYVKNGFTIMEYKNEKISVYYKYTPNKEELEQYKKHGECIDIDALGEDEIYIFAGKKLKNKKLVKISEEEEDKIINEVNKE